MDSGFSAEPMFETFLFETGQFMDQLEQIILECERTHTIDASAIQEIFRIMHTTKGSAAMMKFDHIVGLAHAMEDLFYFLREGTPSDLGYNAICDIILRCVDFIRSETAGQQNEAPVALISDINQYLNILQTTPSSDENVARPDLQEINTGAVPGSYQFHALVLFEPGCEMENIRAFNILHKLKDLAQTITYNPPDILDDNSSAEVIRKNGFEMIFATGHDQVQIENFFTSLAFVRDYELTEIKPCPESKKQIILDEIIPKNKPPAGVKASPEMESQPGGRQSLISVQVNKLDQLMDLVGELVISEAMVTLNPDLAASSRLDNFHKAARQHRKIIHELQDIVMSIRMVPLTITFQKMNRLVRDMSKKLNKEVELEIVGEETEVDKNIIEHLADPLMHLIRNAIDHGIEDREVRIRRRKPAAGQIRLEARNEGGDVWISIKDDGEGLNREKILKRARELNLFDKPEQELTDREIFASILLPGFSTREAVSEFSGRGVGMDVVVQNISAVGGTVQVDSVEKHGTAISLKIPLTLAIIDGMGLKVGNSIYIAPTRSIRESLRVRDENVIRDPDGNEMIMVRGSCYPILRLYQHFNLGTDVTRLAQGIIIIVENESRHLCLFADALLGEQQVVVKALPAYLKKVKGISGCTLLGNGQASLILDIAGLFGY